MVEHQKGKKASGRVNINRASVEDLAKLPMIGRDRAEKLVQYRKEYGEIRNWEDLAHVPSFSQGMIEELKHGDVEL